VFAVVAAALYGAGYFGAAHSKEKEVRGPLTLEQAVSWKDFLKTNEEIQSLKDLVGKDELGFVNFMKKYAPLANLDTNNPSTIEALSTMECVKLLNSPEIVYGLNDEQRQQVCNVVRKLEKLIQATEAGKNMSPTSPSPPTIPSFLHFLLYLFLVLLIKNYSLCCTESRRSGETKWHLGRRLFSVS
jgi:hypothetical protein